MTDLKPDTETPVLEAVAATKHFAAGGATVRAVEEASVALHRGRIVALVGESGSGKTTVARLLARMYPVTGGEIRLDGSPVGRGHPDREYLRRVQLIFQDPFASLHPGKTVLHNLERPLRIHGHVRDRAEARARAAELLERVSLLPAKEFLDKLPHQLSGGQRQRVVIARALAVRPAVLLGDEPISMLDVSIRLDMLNLLTKLRDEEGLALLYITHDIASARYLCDDVQVMYAGQMVEGGPKEDVIQRPAHPYTQLLVDASPDPARDRAADGTADEDGTTLGEPPNLADPPSGCRFRPRCPHAMAVCAEAFPPRTELGGGHWAHCWLHADGSGVTTT
ncbi:dipeptide/oligopeptide/nickel ABC transporter ATP-binding protein [Mangrovactinospora gilvigrisea]|uniref:Dipeptide/oligopeptide/nickel ABC transporter ATP-binding protein n=1 Tax=Mangrovactinospora gilvigrisea TaxID=1428644 RepID=A0A1J7BB21_9ACTN|nr:ABC transporter ATP-binding protein [Mangrovactinospora gilvigrisea]OIV35887.1 dipeptide/oligopeptide/nickel ABC transporter ATP-binding protein [Mangrovactinospora gilvigrisea]